MKAQRRSTWHNSLGLKRRPAKTEWLRKTRMEGKDPAWSKMNLSKVGSASKELKYVASKELEQPQ